jgi:hypothetical protein
LIRWEKIDIPLTDAKILKIKTTTEFIIKNLTQMITKFYRNTKSKALILYFFCDIFVRIIANAQKILMNC